MSGNAPARFLDLFSEPNLLEIVVMIAQVAEIIRAHATRPDGSVRVNLGAYPARIAFNDLVFLVEYALDKLVVFHANRFSDLGHAAELLALDEGNQPIDRFRVSLSVRRDRQAYRVQFHARLRDFRDELIRAGFVRIGDQ